MQVLEAFDLYRFFHAGHEETLALKGVSLSVAAGQMVAVQGPSGSGKSTLLSCLAGLDEPDGGRVALLGRQITRRPETERAAIRARQIGIMLQSGNLFDHLSVEENIALQMHLADRNKNMRARLDELLDKVALQHVRRARPAQISGGEAARAGLAVAVCTRPRVLLADEPTGEVDSRTEQKLIELLVDYKNKGGAVLLVTHSTALASRADRTIHLRDGKVVNHG